MVVRWSFFDPIANETYVFPINPNDGGTPGRAKSITYQATAAPDGVTLMFEGRDQPRKVEFGGIILEQAHLEAFDAWFDKRHQIRLTDHLGRQFWIYLTDFTPTAAGKHSAPWRHTYKATATIVDNP